MWQSYVRPFRLVQHVLRADADVGWHRCHQHCRVLCCVVMIAVSGSSSEGVMLSAGLFGSLPWHCDPPRLSDV